MSSISTQSKVIIPEVFYNPARVAFFEVRQPSQFRQSPNSVAFQSISAHSSTILLW